MTTKWWHIALLILAGYAIGFWMPKLGDMTLAKIYPRKA